MIHTLPTPLALCGLAMVVSGSAVAAQQPDHFLPSLTAGLRRLALDEGCRP